MANATTGPSYELSPRNKSRFWKWFNRAFLTVALLVVVAVIAHGFWGRHEAKKLQELLAQYRAAGEPVSVSEFAAQPVPEDEDAAAVLRKAAQAIDENSEAWQAFDEAEETAAHPLTDKEVEAYRNVVATYVPALEAPAEAARRPKLDWGVAWSSPVFANLDLGYLGEQRRLARLLAADAMLARHDGDYARSLRRADELLLLSRLVDQQSSLITHLVSIGLSAMASDVAVKTAQVMTLKPSEGAKRSLRREQVTALIAALLDTTALEDGRRRFWLGERMMMVDSMQCMADGRISGLSLDATPEERSKSTAFGGYLLRPIAYRDARYMATVMTRAREAAVAPDLPTNRAMLAKDSLDRDPGRGHLFARILLPSFGRAAEQDYKALSDRRMAAVVLACRLYRLEHDDQLPTSLADLVPAYLPAVPVDALTAGQPIGYRRDLETVYSVGSDGRDDGGYEPPPEATRAQVQQKSDDVRHLSLPPRPKLTTPNEDAMPEE